MALKTKSIWINWQQQGPHKKEKEKHDRQRYPAHGNNNNNGGFNNNNDSNKRIFCLNLQKLNTFVRDMAFYNAHIHLCCLISSDISNHEGFRRNIFFSCFVHSLFLFSPALYFTFPFFCNTSSHTMTCLIFSASLLPQLSTYVLQKSRLCLGNRYPCYRSIHETHPSRLLHLKQLTRFQ